MGFLFVCFKVTDNFWWESEEKMAFVLFPLFPVI